MSTLIGRFESMDIVHSSSKLSTTSIHDTEENAGERPIEKEELQFSAQHAAKEYQIFETLSSSSRVVGSIPENRGKFDEKEYPQSIIGLNIVKSSDYDQHQYESAKIRIAQDPKIITSHSVFVIDCSGSMKKADVEAHRSRADAVSYAVATEFIAKRLHNPSSGVSHFDVVTVIEMREGASIVFYKEPLSWVFYNKFIEQAKKTRSSKPSSPTEYKNLLSLVHETVIEIDHKNLALLLVFFFGTSNLLKYRYKIRNLFLIGYEYQERLTFGFVGYSSFGTDSHDMMDLENLVSYLEMEGITGEFCYPDLEDSISSFLAKLSSMLLTKKRALQR